MRFSKSISLSALGIILFSGLLFTACGSFQNASYYSDGIYNDDNVIVIRRTQNKPAANAYTQYFDQQAKQYNWDDSNDDVALTNVDSLNQGNLNNYQSNPNWGGGNKTTQIIIQSTPLNFGFGGNWGYGGFYDPYLAYWDYNFYNPYRWNRFAWGFNRPFFNGYYPYYGYGFYNNPYFYGGGFWNGFGYGYAYNNPYSRPFNRINNNRRSNAARNRAYSPSYRGQAAIGGRSQINTRAVQRENNSPANASLENGNARQSRTANTEITLPNLVQQGRTASVRQTQNLDDTENRVRRSQNSQENQNRSHIDRVVRRLQGNGIEVQVINDANQARQYSQQNSDRNVVNLGGRSNTQAVSRNNNSNNTATEYRSSRNYNNSSSTRNANSNVRSNSSRSYSAPARVSSGGGRSSSSGRSSSGRSSSSGRRQ